MDKHLRPTRFETEPNTTNAEKEWRHWYHTFVNFLDVVYPPQQQAAPAVTAAQFQAKKLGTRINYISASIYDYVAEAPDYDSAIMILENLYVKPRSVIFNRHQLATTKQNNGGIY